MYEKLEKAWLRERASDELQPLEPGFYKEMREWIEKLRREARNSNDIMKKVLERQAEICDTMLTSLLRMRSIKVAALLVSDRVPENVKEELRFLRSVLGVKKLELEKEAIKIEKREGARGIPLVLVTFKSHVPAFVGVDLAVYGPFSEGDVAHIPEENARILARRGLVEVFPEDESTKCD